MADISPIHASDITAIVGKDKWIDTLRVDADLESFFGPGMTGAPGSDLPVIRQPVAGGQAGVAIDVPLLGTLDGEGVSGETALQGNEEAVANSHQSVTPTIYRHAVANTLLAKFKSAVDLVAFARNALAKWAGKKRDRLIFDKVLAVTTHMFGGDATSRATLSSDDTFGTAELVSGKLHLQRIGARPLRVESDAQGRKIAYYGVLVSSIDEANLKTDTVWLQTHREVGELADKNPVYSGAIGIFQGMIVYPYSELAGSGSPLRPETILKANISNSDTTITVGGTKAGVDYTKYFPATGTLLIDAETIAYTGKTVGSFTGCTRGGGAAAHIAGALITLNNLTMQVFFGAEAIAEGNAQEPTPVTQEADYGFIQGLGVMMNTGFEVVKDVAGKPANLAVMECYGVSPV